MGGAGEPRHGARPAPDARPSAAGPHLSPPSPAFHRSYLDALAEYHAEGRHPELDLRD